jgi:hypothetical protein
MGLRSAFQVQRWVDGPVFEALRQRGDAAARMNRGKKTIPVHPHVRTIRTFELSPGIVEATVVVKTDRTRAVALRLQWHHGRWMATSLTFV